MNGTATPHADADSVMCAVCKQRFGDRDHFVDHLEESHSVITNVVRRHTVPLSAAEPADGLTQDTTNE